METIKKRILIIVILAFALSCKKEEVQKPLSLQGGKTAACSSGAAAAENSGVLFEVGNQNYASSDMAISFQQQKYENEIAGYSKNLQLIEEYALRIYLAQKQNKLKDRKNPPGIQELLATSKVSENEIRTFFKEQQHQMPPGSTYLQVKNQIEEYLNGQKISKVYAEKLAEMKTKSGFRSFLVAPVAPSFNLDTSLFPMKGNASAKVKIIAISDYLCGHCQMSYPQLKNIISSYSNDISFAQVDFSLRPNGISGTYGRGAYCAKEQSLDAFWKYHEEAFKTASAVPHDHSKHGQEPPEVDGRSPEATSKVIAIAATVQLDTKKFERCLNSPKAFEWVKKIGALMNDNGVNGTPLYIVNGKRLERGVEEMEEAIKTALQ